MAHKQTSSTNDRILTVMLALGAFALVGLLAGGFAAGFIDALGQVARAVAGAFGASKEVAKVAEIGAEALGRVAKILFL